jgi:hypothetical protein
LELKFFFKGFKLFLPMLIDKFIKISRNLFKLYFKKWCIIKDMVEETAEDGKLIFVKFPWLPVYTLQTVQFSRFMDCSSDYPKEEWI